MSDYGLFETGTKSQNLTHFAGIISMTYVDSRINEKEKKLLFLFADILKINEDQFTEVVSDPEKFPVEPVVSRKEQLKGLFKFFRLSFFK